MIREERLQKIVQDINGHGSVNVLELSIKYQVSPMTIRRDLATLEDRGLLERIHGGALHTAEIQHRIEPPIIERMNVMAEEKKRIAVWVANYIKPDDSVFLGSGTTTLYVARELIIRDDITVVTNSVPILHELSNNSNMNIITVGGFLRRSELSMIGAFAEPVLKNIRVTKVIAGMRGIHPLYGFSCEHPEELMTDRMIFNISDVIIIVADHTKIGRVATNIVAPITHANLIVTSKQANQNQISKIKEQGVDVKLV